MKTKHEFRETIPSRTYEKVYKDYRKYKLPLSLDFLNRCGYCDIKDTWLGGRKVYHIDHFAPQEKFPELENVYSNLVYSCPYCNVAKSDDWPSEDCNVGVCDGKGYIDPCTKEYGILFCRDDLGNIVPCSNVGEYMYEQLNLGSPRHAVVWNLERLKKLKKELKVAEPHFTINEDLKMRFIELSLMYDEYFEYLGDLLNE